MRYFELFDSNLTLLQSATNLRFVGTFQPQFNRFFDHRFRAFRRFALADDAKFRAIGYIPAVFTRLNHSSQLWKFHHEESSPSSKSSRIVTLIAVIWRKFFRAEGWGGRFIRHAASRSQLHFGFAAFGFSTCVGITLIDVGPTQQIVESADPVPSVTIAFQHNAVFAGVVSPAVVLSKKINQQLALCTTHARIQENFTRLLVKIV
jgi:hypothetical protein